MGVGETVMGLTWYARPEEEMRAARVAAAFFVVGVLIGLTLTAAVARADDPEAQWVAVLAGKNEAPTPRDTNGRGVALFFMNDDGSMSFKVIVANIYNVILAHIHCGPAGVAGPVGVTLLMGVAPGGGRVDGLLVAGSFSAPNSGNSCGWASLADVAAAVAAGTAYMNVHTNDGIDPINTGPGDFPAGEIRGQLKATD